MIRKLIIENFINQLKKVYIKHMLNFYLIFWCKIIKIFKIYTYFYAMIVIYFFISLFLVLFDEMGQTMSTYETKHTTYLKY